MKQLIRKSLLYSIFAIFISACGGGGSDSTSKTKTETTSCEIGASTFGSCEL